MYIVNLENSPVEVRPILSIPLYRFLVNQGFIPIGVLYGHPSFTETKLLKEVIEKFEKEVYNSESDSKV